MLELRPMALGEIIDRAASIWRANWKVLFRLFLAFGLAQYALLKSFQLLQMRYFPLARGGARMAEALKDRPDEATRQLASSIGSAAAMVVLIFLISLVSGVAGTRYLMPRVLGRESTLAESVAHARKRLGTTVLAFGLMMGWSVLVGVMFCVPALALAGGAWLQRESALGLALAIMAAVALMLGLLAWLLWFIVRVSVLGQVVSAEPVSAWRAFVRSDALTSGRIGPGFLGLVKVRLTVLITVVGLILSLTSMVSSAPALVITALYGNMFDPLHSNPDAVPQLLLVPAELFSTVVQSIIAPLYLAFQVIFYVDMRNRREGLDLELKLQEAA